MNGLGGVNEGKKSSINHKGVAWESYGLSKEYNLIVTRSVLVPVLNCTSLDIHHSIKSV